MEPEKRGSLIDYRPLEVPLPWRFVWRRVALNPDPQTPVPAWWLCRDFSSKGPSGAIWIDSKRGILGFSVQSILTDFVRLLVPILCITEASNLGMLLKTSRGLGFTEETFKKLGPQTPRNA